ncbi:MAG: glycosyltransferase [Bryobacteraceae bacterium]|nr:glycosyltransferase [Bryobacteraceae bacterium]
MHMEELAPPRVTALIVAHQDEHELRRCIEALERSEQREGLEILVVDDGLDAATSAVADEFPDVVSLKLPRFMGWTRAVNIGLRTAKGDLVFLIPPWFQVEPATVSRLADRLQASAITGAVCPRMERVWQFPAPENLLKAWPSEDLPGAILTVPGEMEVDYPRGAPMMIGREYLRNMNYLDQRFGDRWADLELCSRIRSGGKKIVVLGDVPVMMTQPPEPETDSLQFVDSANGVATWISLHYGFAAGLKARLRMAFSALSRGKTTTFTGILSGNKIDGNQE